MAVRKKNTKEVPASGGRALKGVLAVAAVGILAGAIYIVINPTEPKAPVHVASVREERQAILDEKIPKSGPAAQPPAHGNVAPPKIPAPVSIAPSSGGDKPVAAPVSIADSTLKIGDPSKADPVELALHPSHFADPTKLVSKIGIVSIPLEGEPQNSALSPQHSALPPDSYAEAVRLEKARAFTMSMCQGLDGRIWIGSENTQPGDGTGGVQVWDPSKPPLESFTQFLSNESAARTRSVSKDARVQGGLGDDNGYAVACDLQGRIWVGHLNHGVSVYNGEKWQNYEVVAGLSIPGSLNGPLGERIFHITICNADVPSAIFHDTLTGVDSPIHGSVWMCTSAGLSIYFPSTDTWSYLTRADGLPSDQANSLAFGPDGTVYVATQCDGIAIASAKDQYKTWKNVRGPDELPTTPTGDGLSTNLMNDILVAKDGSVWAATCDGLSRSLDGGRSWAYLRGLDSYGKSRLSSNAGPAPNSGLLDEDFCTSLAEGADGEIALGHRRVGFQVLASKLASIETHLGDGYITAMLEGSSFTPLAGSYGEGLSALQFRGSSGGAGSPQTMTAFPSGARVSFAASASLGGPSRSAEKLEPISLLGQDWLTEGEWLGRYGRYWACLCGFMAPQDMVWGANAQDVFYTVGGEANKQIGDLTRQWVAANYTSDPRSLEFPRPFLTNRIAKGLTTGAQTRRQAEWDDHGEAHARSQPGLAIECSLQVPLGEFVLTLYNVNDDGHKIPNSERDLLINLVSTRNGARFGEAHSRVEYFWGGVYTRFLVKGPCTVECRVEREFSLNSTLNGLFLDTLEAVPEPYFVGGTVKGERQGGGDSTLTTGAMDRRFEVMLARVRDQRIISSRESDPYFYLQDFYKWEADLKASSIPSPREVELDLRWDGRDKTSSAECGELVEKWVGGYLASSKAIRSGAVSR